MSHHSDLIDTTEMYLRTVYELEEEGVTALRARIAERLGQSGPTVSQTVARMERDGLLRVAGDRHLVLTDKGRQEAIAVMRKHRLAERLLVDVIGLEWEDVHVEACRWEHVMSEAVERRIVAMLAPPLVCPHGNPIPGLEELGVPGAGPTAPGSGRTTGTAAANAAPSDGVAGAGSPFDSASFDSALSDSALSDSAPSDSAPSDSAPSDSAPSDSAPSDGASNAGASRAGASRRGTSSDDAPGRDRWTGLLPLSDAAPAGGDVVVERISEQVQSDTGLLRELRAAGIAPGVRVSVSEADGAAVLRAPGGRLLAVPEHIGEHIFVRRA